MDIPPHLTIQPVCFHPLATLSSHVDRSTSSVDNPTATTTFSTLVRRIGRERIGGVERGCSLHVEVTRSPEVVKRLSTGVRALRKGVECEAGSAGNACKNRQFRSARSTPEGSRSREWKQRQRPVDPPTQGACRQGLGTGPRDPSTGLGTGFRPGSERPQGRGLAGLRGGRNPDGPWVPSRLVSGRGTSRRVSCPGSGVARGSRRGARAWRDRTALGRSPSRPRRARWSGRVRRRTRRSPRASDA